MRTGKISNRCEPEWTSKLSRIESMNYTDVLDSYGTIIEKDLKSRLDEMVRDGQKYHPFLGNVYDATREFVQRGGRKLSACSTLIVYQGFAGKIDERIVRVCFSMGSWYPDQLHQAMALNRMRLTRDLAACISLMHLALWKIYPHSCI